MRLILALGAFVFFTLSFLAIGTSANLEETKEAACSKWSEVGYKCVGYEGYQFGRWLGGGYGGAKVWHSLKRSEAPGIIYTGYIQKWGNEFHVYGPTATDAVKGQ